MLEKLKDWIEIYNKNLNIEVWSMQKIIFKGKIKDFKSYEIFKDCKIINQSVNDNFNYYYINTSNLIKQQLKNKENENKDLKKENDVHKKELCLITTE